MVDNGVVDGADRRGAVADLAAAMATVAAEPGGPWLVVAGDNLVAAEDLAAMVARYERDDVPLVACRDLGDASGTQFGEVTLDADGRILRFREKPAQPTSSLASTCTYVLGPDAPATVGAVPGLGRRRRFSRPVHRLAQLAAPSRRPPAHRRTTTTSARPRPSPPLGHRSDEPLSANRTDGAVRDVPSAA